MPAARYDDVAEWYDQVFSTSELGAQNRALACELLGEGSGTLLDVGCGGGLDAVAFAARGWSVEGVDLSPEQVRLARERGVEASVADAGRLPFPDDSFDAVTSLWLHTDVDSWPSVVQEVERVLRPGGRFAYVGAHPCFVGPHTLVEPGDLPPRMFPGYRTEGRYTESPGVRPEGLRARVGAVHVTLESFLRPLLTSRLDIVRFTEPAGRDYPYTITLLAFLRPV